MKRIVNLMAMLLCVSTFATISSCSKDNEENNTSTENYTNIISGKWECIESSAMPNLSIEEDAYAGTIWEFKNAIHEESSGYIKGTFNVRIGNTSYNDGSFELYVDAINSNHKSLIVSANTDNHDFACFQGSYITYIQMEEYAIYDKVLFSGDKMTLLQENSNGETIASLLFKKI